MSPIIDASAAPIASHFDGSRLKPATEAIIATPRMVEGSFNFANNVFMVFWFWSFYTTIPHRCKFREAGKRCATTLQLPRTRSIQRLRAPTFLRANEKCGCPLAQTALADEFFGECAWLQNDRAPLAAGSQFDLDIGRDRG